MFLRTRFQFIVGLVLSMLSAKIYAGTPFSNTVPILMYHHLRVYNKTQPKHDSLLSVSPQKLEEQLMWLKTNGYQTIAPKDLLADTFAVAKPIILTFDDGYKDAYTVAFPLLKKYGYRGVFYIIVNQVGYLDYLTWPQILEMQQGGMVFGAHTLSHADLRSLSKEKLAIEVGQSKNILEEKLGQKITDFCYPYGRFNKRMAVTLKEAGYQTAMAATMETAKEKLDFFQLPRFMVQNKTVLGKILQAEPKQPSP